MKPTYALAVVAACAAAGLLAAAWAGEPAGIRLSAGHPSMQSPPATAANEGVIELRPAPASPWADVRKLGLIDIRSEFLLDARSATALNELPPTQDAIERVLGLAIPEKPIEITLFRSRGSFNRYISQRVPEGVGRSALFVQGIDAGRVYAYYSGRMDTDIRHESTHALLHSALPYVPLWLDEGLAEYFEAPPARRYAGHPSLKPSKRAAYFRWRPNLTRLESISVLRDMGEDEYRESWAWVHWMIHGPEPVREILRTYLDEIARGGFPGKLEPRLRRVVRDPAESLRAHVRSVR